MFDVFFLNQHLVEVFIAHTAIIVEIPVSVQNIFNFQNYFEISKSNSDNSLTINWKFNWKQILFLTRRKSFRRFIIIVFNMVKLGTLRTENFSPFPNDEPAQATNLAPTQPVAKLKWLAKIKKPCILRIWIILDSKHYNIYS